MIHGVRSPILHLGPPSIALALGSLALAACDEAGGQAPLTLEVKDNAAVAGKKPDEIEILFKTDPDAELHFQGETRNVGDKATESFVVSKSKLALGKNTFTVTATTGVLFSKKTATATAIWDAPVKSFVRFFPVGGEGASLTCGGAMCGATNFRMERNGKLDLEAESALEGTLTFAGKKDEVGPGKRRSFEVDLASVFPTLPLDRRDTLALPLTLETRSGGSGNETLELRGPALEAELTKELAGVQRGPVTFTGEAPAGAEPRAVAVVNTARSTPGTLLFVGKPKTVAEVDLVALAKPAERFFSCSPTTSASGILYLDLAIDVYERRTGKLVHSRKLMADRVPCPPAATAGTVKADVRESDIRRALGELLKQKT
jgi:hypothetical protein